VYVGVKISLDKCESEVDFISLELNDFDVILGMNWLSKHKAHIDFFFGKLTYVLKEEDTNIIRGIPQIYNDNRNINNRWLQASHRP
jgi:hypothetical protein